MKDNVRQRGESQDHRTDDHDKDGRPFMVSAVVARGQNLGPLVRFETLLFAWRC
jgi:hypothetical protein